GAGGGSLEPNTLSFSTLQPASGNDSAATAPKQMASRAVLQCFIGRIRPNVSLHRRDHEFRAFLGAGGRTGGHGLGLGIEANRVRPVLVEVAETRALPAAESVVRERHRYGKVDTDHPDLDAVGEIPRGVAVAREDRDTVAVLV